MIRLLSLFLFMILSPAWVFGQNWYKGNLHTHSYWSDGDEFPEMIMDWYKTHGYQFIGLSDHNTLATGEKWKKITKAKLYEDGFKKYLDKYGEKWVAYKSDSGRITVRLKTFAEYKPLFADKNFLLIPSEEITSRYDGRPIHMNATNVQTILPPRSGASVTEVMQKTVDAVAQQRAETGVPMFLHLNHPNFVWGVSLQDIIDLHGERFFEVYNGHPAVHNYGDSLRPGTEEMWDKINIAYLQRGQPMMYGLATDDSHMYHQFGGAFSNAGRGWVMVNAKVLTPEALIEAMEAGSFYASTGVTLGRMEYRDHRINVAVKGEKGVQYTIELVGVKKGEDKSSVLKSVSGTKATFDVTPEYLFVRTRVTSTKKENPFQEGDVEMAWGQPVN